MYNKVKSVRINVSLPEDVLKVLSREAPGRQRSRFICEAVLSLIKEKRDIRLARDYRQAAAEIRRINKEMEGVVSDGLD